MKNLPVFVCLFLISFVVHAGEQRLTAFHRRGEAVSWIDKVSEFPGVVKNASRRGSLIYSRVKNLDSVHPYDLDAGKLSNRASIIDDLFYESLFLPDPVTANERMYPLLAQALRVDDQLSYVIFEIDPRARFQDGSEVSAADILFSIEVFKNSSPLFKEKIETIIQSTSVAGLELRIDLKTRGQASRDAIMILSSLKIVKPNTTGAIEMGGIRTRFTPTGSYRLTQLGRSKMSLIIDPAYWGRELSVRRGFFNFRVVEVIAFTDEQSARASVAGETTNFFEETQPGRDSSSYFKKANQNIRHVEETVSPIGAPIPVLAFNLASPVVNDWRVRQAILLAYDFQGINIANFGGVLRRPLGILDDSPVGPEASPVPAVQALLDTCDCPRLGAFETHGHAQYKSIADKRLRLFTATRLLQDSGFKLEHGVLHRPLGDGRMAPLQLRLLVREGEQRSAYLLRADLLRLGIEVGITSADGDAFRMLRSQGAYELVSSVEDFADKEGWPSVAKLQLHESQRVTCVTEMLRTMEKEDPAGDVYLDNAEAIARVHAALHLSIYTGAPTKRNYFLDDQLVIPSHLSARNIHMYGYWIEQEAAAGFVPVFPFDFRQIDFGDVISR